MQRCTSGRRGVAGRQWGDLDTNGTASSEREGWRCGRLAREHADCAREGARVAHSSNDTEVRVSRRRRVTATERWSQTEARDALKGLTRFEGKYTFHAVATFGEGCTGTRETTWTTYVSVAIDPGHTGVKTSRSERARGPCAVRATLIRRPRWQPSGNGPPRCVAIVGQPGSDPLGGVRDNRWLLQR